MTPKIRECRNKLQLLKKVIFWKTNPGQPKYLITHMFFNCAIFNILNISELFLKMLKYKMDTHTYVND